MSTTQSHWLDIIVEDCPFGQISISTFYRQIDACYYVDISMLILNEYWNL
jgi:hypothetical protein